jgi:hypothetical protein
MVQHALSMKVHAITIVAQEKTQSYIECTSKDHFIPLGIRTYGCFHSHFDSFFTSRVHATINHH